jgi:alpha,alpha-trehalase
MRTKSNAALALLGLALAGAPESSAQELPSPERREDVRRYIKQAWTTLTRSVRDLPRAAPDPKLKAHRGAWLVYLSAREDVNRVEAELSRQLDAAGRREIELRTLPADTSAIREHGLLYLPHPYVVPGGRFNEMYGWDSYFILVGLLRDDEVALAKDMTDNFLYEIEHYGTVLNANRTYYLSRSQPPFLTRMVLGVFERTKDREWLRAALPAIEKHYDFWTSPPHLVPETGLSRYFDLGSGPAPEVLADEVDEKGRSHYDRVREYYRTHEVTDYDLALYYDKARDALTELFYKGDRSMRESGFDPSNRFGPFSVDIVHHVPVCLNVLLYQMEADTEAIYRTLGDEAAASRWKARADERRQRIDRYLWDSDAGLYVDYDFKTGRRRHYEFATTFYPLWAGIASKEQAARVEKSLPRFEAPGGLLTSTTRSGNQWDAPFGWAPLQLLAVDGLRRYGYKDDADRLARKFVSLVAKEFGEHGTIVEKYDVVRSESDVEAGIRFGYSGNQVGFGWTNGAFLELLAELEAPRHSVAGIRQRASHEPVQSHGEVLRRGPRENREDPGPRVGDEDSG